MIVPAFTWVATANVVELTRAERPSSATSTRTFNIDVEQVESLVTERTVGIVGVHLFGLSADIDPLLDLCRRRGLWFVEDAACALGAWYRGRHVGTFGVASAFSFHPRKSITTGEGGMVATNDDSLAASHALAARSRLVARRTVADEEEDAFLLSDFPRVGFNFRMTDIQGALGCAQMDRLDEILVCRPRSRRATTSCSPASTSSSGPSCRTATSTATRRTCACSVRTEPVPETVERMHRARTS